MQAFPHTVKRLQQARSFVEALEGEARGLKMCLRIEKSENPEYQQQGFGE
jgi:hypothetical protein